jgi:prepilin-type N-terminal cleavage/methylation domain-containing protein
MADPRPNAGFTLIELMIAIGILLFGVTTLAGVLSVGLGTRRSAEQQLRASALVDQVLLELEQDVLPGIDPLATELPPVEVDGPPGFPELKYRVDFTLDPERPEVVLARIEIGWREQGDWITTRFRRVLFRQAPFAQRVQRLGKRR